jgi:hypothetical protein
MATLDSGLRNALDTTIGRARDEAERAAARALTTLAVNQADPFPTLSEDERRLRNQLRAKARQLGDRERLDNREPLTRAWALVGECAYEHWHRMLFARFLAENGLLIYPDAGVAVSLADCAQIAAELGMADPWVLVAEYAARMLPGIFRADDPLLHVPLAAEGRQALERLLEGIPAAVFTSEDGLGWVYQFWQSRRKAEVNASGAKIGGADIAPVTQLFTEPYMVEFLLHNTLGAWWAARHPDDPLVAELTYLRRLDDGTPAAGTFDGWPKRAAEVTVMDPCCGSGHFLVAAFNLLRRMREREEGLTHAEACVATLRDNIHGLEIDARCTQIAAFALALAAWKAAGYQALPVPHVACSGIPVGGRLYEWTSLAGGDTILAENLRRLYDLFRDTPEYGSLIDPSRVVGTGLFASNVAQVMALLERTTRQEKTEDDSVKAIFGQLIEGATRAAILLSKSFTLVTTNVPYLGQNKHTEEMKEFLGHYYPNSKADIATAFIQRCRAFTILDGSYAIVTPQSWFYIGSYKKLRIQLLELQSWNHAVRLGAGAFETIGGEVVSVGLVIITNSHPQATQSLTGLDATAATSPLNKIRRLQNGPLQSSTQKALLLNPDSRISLNTNVTGLPLLSEYADSYWGIGLGDSTQFVRCFWELPTLGSDWDFLQGTFSPTNNYTGREHVVLWQNGNSDLIRLAPQLGNRPTRGYRAWGRLGVIISQMGSLSAALYTGEIFENGAAAITPKDQTHLQAIWAFCRSSEYYAAVRNIDQKLSVTNATLVKVPFDLAHWQAVADAAGPLPDPYSDDPTQWLFHGDPARATAPLQVALARLLGYRWPQNEEDGLCRFADEDGVVCLDAVAGEPPAAERLRAILAAAYGERWSPAVQERLLTEVGFGGKGLDGWLRDGAGFFKQHCALFHNRPFLWQVWDGRKDGFSAIVNYHALDGRKLDRLIYTYLGAWIAQQRADAEAAVTGADLRLGAAQALQQKLVAIREGEPPYDIYVRWKSADKQPLGWEPDLNDGVRLNVRPFVTAGVLRAKFTVNWNKDRGTNPDGSARLNDLHLSRAEKEAARRGETVTPWATEADRAAGKARR